MTSLALVSDVGILGSLESNDVGFLLHLGCNFDIWGWQLRGFGGGQMKGRCNGCVSELR